MDAIFKEVKEFLKKSSERYSSEIKKQTKDLELYNGNFWSDELKKKYHRTSAKKLCLHFSDWSVLANAIASPYADSPWHINLLNREEANEEVQETINVTEQDNDNKSAGKLAFVRAIVCGAGFIIATTDEIEDKIIIEFVNRQDSVALDPDIETPEGSDAERGAIVTYMSIDKAKRLYGDDIVPISYPRVQPQLSFIGISQWADENNKIQVVTYYKKNTNGFVTMYKLCGNKLIGEPLDLPIKYIPIIRFAAYTQYTSEGNKYSGIVNKTYDLQVGLNIAYSTLMERANRSIKANLIATTDAVNGLDAYYKKMCDEDGMFILHNPGTDAPKPVEEHFQTGDLRDIIQSTRELIADVIGVPLAGIIGINDKTATEILVQKSNQQSNVSEFYDNAFRANKLLARIIIEILNNGKDVLFELENGPDTVNNNLKHRQELQAVANLLPQEMQPLIAIAMTDTIKSGFIDNLKSNIIANIGDKLKLVAPNEDPYAVAQLRQMQAMVNQTMDELEKTKMALAESEKQNEVLNLQMLNTKEDRMLEYQKMQNDRDLKIMELTGKVSVEQSKLEEKTMTDLQKLENDKNKIILDAMK